MLAPARGVLLGPVMMNKVLGTLLLVAGSATFAAAEPTVSLSTSVMATANGVIDAGAEVRAIPHLGVSVTGGYGHLMWKDNLPASQVGASVNYYPLRAFSGLHVGVESMHLHGKDIEPWGTDSATINVVGGYVGYKWLLASGLTAVVEVGYGKNYIQTSGSGAFMSTAPVIFPDVTMISNLQLGYSF